MIKAVRYVCQGCGTVHSKWKGQCEGCREWNLMISEKAPKSGPAHKKSAEEALFQPLMGETKETTGRILSGIAEFDRVCGGGLVTGSVSLVAGDPGIGKSTLLLQVAAQLSAQLPVLYISGEESVTQVRLRAQRLGLEKSAVHVMSHNAIEAILNSVAEHLTSRTSPAVGGPPAFLIVDSIQTMASSTISGASGTVTQVRECMDQLVTLAKSTGIAIMVVGHITKDGLVAGPKVLEHMVDTVLYFEGERSYPYRLLRVVKNRFGATDEIGIFDMTETGLKEVSNPSSLFLSHRQEPIAGACVFAGIEGTRPLLMEIQALSTSSFLPSPRRAVVGWDVNRLSVVVAVLEARCQLSFSNKDIFLSVLGGMKITDPAADLCVAMALLSCLKKRPLKRELLAFGEIGLTGEITSVPYGEQRLKEAQKHGFEEVCMPTSKASSGLLVHPMNHVKDLIQFFQSRSP